LIADVLTEVYNPTRKDNYERLKGILKEFTLATIQLNKPH